MLPVNVSSQIIGLIGTLFYIVLLGSPLSKINEVIRLKSAKAIPLPFTIACSASSFLWSIDGLLDVHDVYIYGPSLIGFFLNVIQFILLAVYGGKQNVLSPFSYRNKKSGKSKHLEISQIL